MKALWNNNDNNDDAQAFFSKALYESVDAALLNKPQYSALLQLYEDFSPEVTYYYILFFKLLTEYLVLF